ncbi:hypothetical protein [Flavobacterium beibuense]|nr:hypothetical protein [Flavobacterium beibuense]
MLRSHPQTLPGENDESTPFESTQTTGQTVTNIPKKTILTDFETVEELVERVKSLVTNAVEQRTEKENFLPGIRKVLGDYPSLGKSRFRGSINEFIVSEGEEQGMASLTQEEVDKLWVDH